MGQYADQRMAAEMAKWKVKGASIAIVDAQRVVFANGCGQAATPDTTYRVGSISKLLTATEVMRRVERGEIDRDGPFSGQLPGFRIRGLSAGGKPLTVRSMLAHHSGLPSDQLKGMWLPQRVRVSLAPSADAEASVLLRQRLDTRICEPEAPIHLLEGSAGPGRRLSPPGNEKSLEIVSGCQIQEFFHPDLLRLNEIRPRVVRWSHLPARFHSRTSSGCTQGASQWV